MQRLITFLSPLWRIWYSKEFYREIVTTRKGTGLGYCSLALFILLLPSLLLFHNVIKDLRDKKSDYSVELSQIIDQMPQLRVTNGQIHTDAPQPFTITAPRKNIPFIVIDTESPEASITHPNAVIIVTNRHIILQNGKPSELGRFSVTELMEAAGKPTQTETIITSEDLHEWFDSIARLSVIAPYAYYLSLWVYMFVYTLIQALLFFPVSAALCSLLRVKLESDSVLRVAAYTTLPILCFKSLSFTLMHPIFAHETLVYLCLHGIYLFIALEANKTRS